MFYSLWDTDSANQIDTFATEAEALADVRLAVGQFGRDHARHWGLAQHDDDDLIAIAHGEALIDRAFAAIRPDRALTG